jgi:hypothetical protein
MATENGNMTCREEKVEGVHGTWKQTYNEENVATLCVA